MRRNRSVLSVLLLLPIYCSFQSGVVAPAFAEDTKTFNAQGTGLPRTERYRNNEWRTTNTNTLRGGSVGVSRNSSSERHHEQHGGNHEKSGHHKEGGHHKKGGHHGGHKK